MTTATQTATPNYDALPELTRKAILAEVDRLIWADLLPQRGDAINEKKEELAQSGAANLTQLIRKHEVSFS